MGVADLQNPIANMPHIQQLQVSHQQQAQAAVADWNALHDASGSFADAHSTL